jgi:DNA-binding response OmpR family regulator
VLLIDDSDDARDVYAEVLRLEGFAVEEVVESGIHDSSADVLLPKPCPLDTLLLEVRQLLRAAA